MEDYNTSSKEETQEEKDFLKNIILKYESFSLLDCHNIDLTIFSNNKVILETKVGCLTCKSKAIHETTINAIQLDELTKLLSSKSLQKSNSCRNDDVDDGGSNTIIFKHKNCIYAIMNSSCDENSFCEGYRLLSNFIYNLIENIETKNTL